MKDNRLKSVGYGVVITTGMTIASRIIAVIINMAVIKILSPAELGTFLGIQAMVYIGCGVCDLGLSHGYRQMASRNHLLRQVLLGPTLCIQFMMLALYLFGLTIYMFHSGNLTLGATLIAIGALTSQWPDVMGIDLYIVREFRKAGILNILSSAGLAIGVLLAWFCSDAFLALATGYSIGMIGYSICAVLLVDRKNLKFNFTSMTFSQARISVPFLSSIIISRFGLNFGLSYLLATQSSHAAGIVGFPLKLYQISLLLSTATTSVMLPHFHKLATNATKADLGAALGKLIGPLWVIMGCAAGVCFLCPDMIVSIVGNSQYVESAFYLRIFSGAMLLKSLSIPAGDLLESRGMQWYRVIAQSTSTFIVVSSILLLYPRYGMSTVAYSVLAADTVSFFLLWGINSVGMTNMLPWRKHILGSIALFSSVCLAWSISTTDTVTTVLYLIMFIIIATLLRVWSPLTLAERIIGKRFTCGKTTPEPFR